MVATDTRSFFQKLEDYTDRSGGTDACWLWTGCRSSQGYGSMSMPGVRKQVVAHRVAWIVFHGPIPDGMEVCHACDNPPCCNPSHLFLGTHRDNLRDAEEKGRLYRVDARGEKHGQSKLSGDDVAAIRDLRRNSWSRADIAAVYGISPSYVSEICLGRTWKHIPLPAPPPPAPAPKKKHKKKGGGKH